MTPGPWKEMNNHDPCESVLTFLSDNLATWKLGLWDASSMLTQNFWMLISIFVNGERILILYPHFKVLFFNDHAFAWFSIERIFQEVGSY